MSQTYNLHVKDFIPLITPKALEEELPLTDKARETVLEARKSIQGILDKKDKRLLVITGPCSIHDEEAALEYAENLLKLKDEISETEFLVMRVYFEKPRTNVGWKGLINDPCMDGTCDIDEGMRRARKLLLKINEMGIPAATELLDPITPQYISDLISWVAIGARTTESQTHREMASGLSMPVGFKNGTDGTLSSAINGIIASKSPQNFLGINDVGQTCIVHTIGNPWSHIVLRGGDRRPNYDPISIEEACHLLGKKGLPEAIMVDCSHDNSGKKCKGQPFVWKSVLDQKREGNHSIIGMMLESNLFEGNQKCDGNFEDLKYGVSITDECLSWETTEQLLLFAHKKLSMG